jgi:RNA polymerase sigma-70 factor (ECF subfamily)
MEDDDVEPHPDSGPATKLERKEELTRVGRAIRQLPEKQQEALLLKLDAGLSYKQIAEVMQLSVSNVGFILHQAVQAIRNDLASESGLPAVARRMS